MPEETKERITPELARRYASLAANMANEAVRKGYTEDKETWKKDAAHWSQLADDLEVQADDSLIAKGTELGFVSCKSAIE